MTQPERHHPIPIMPHERPERYPGWWPDWPMLPLPPRQFPIPGNPRPLLPSYPQDIPDDPWVQV